MLSSACGGARIKALEDKTAADVRDLRELQAETTASLNQIRQEIRQIQGQIEELQYRSTGKAAELERSLRRLGSRVPPPAGVPEDLLNSDQEKIARISGDAAEGFKRGLGLLRAGDFETARAAFGEFAEANPGTAFTDNALFWQGICYIKLGQYDQAVVSLSEVYQTYPAEDMVAPSLYFLGQSFEKLGGYSDAVDTLQKLIDDHPRSSYAKEARKEIRSLKRRR